MTLARSSVAPAPVTTHSWELPTAQFLAESARHTRLLGRVASPNPERQSAALAQAVLSGAKIALHHPPGADDLGPLLGTLESLIVALEREHEPRADLYACRAREIHLEARIATELGGKHCAPLFRRRFPGPSLRAIALARSWIATDAGPQKEDASCTSDGAESSSLRARLALRAAPLGFAVHVRHDLVALAAVGANCIYVAKGRRLSPHDVARTVVHEIEGHALPQFHAQRSTVPLFRVGTAEATDDQEGYAVLCEEGAGLLSRVRMRALAERTLAAARMAEGWDAMSVTRELIHVAHCTPLAAARTAVRVFRGSDGTALGLGRERVYLDGYIRVKGLPSEARALLGHNLMSAAIAQRTALPI